MADYKEIISSLQREVEQAVREGFRDYKDQAEAEARAFYAGVKADLENWAKALVEGLLSQEDFEWLLHSKKDLIKLEGLRQAGAALARVERVRMKIIDITLRVIFSRLLP